MKNLSKLLFIIYLIPCLSLAGSKVCFDREISMYCEAELDQNYSLNGYFVKGGQKYNFFARRAFDGGWCQDTLKSIMKVMKSGPFCIGFEESVENLELTIDFAESRTSKWTYFQ